MSDRDAAPAAQTHYDDTPDTTVWAPDLPQRFGTGLGYGRCGCSPTDGQSCPSCTGGSAAEWEDVKARRDEVRQQWRAGRLTARQYYALSAAVSSDGLPSRDAVEALARAESVDDDELRDVHSLTCAVWTSDDPCTCQTSAGIEQERTTP